MRKFELTHTERAKVALKWFASLFCSLVGGFYVTRCISKPSVTIVAYHRIIGDCHEGVCPYISVRKSALRQQVRFFKKHYSVISLGEAIDRLSTKRIDQHYLVLTFDDGYLDNYSLGLDIFLNEGIRPAVFVTTDCIEKQHLLWPDTIRRLIYGARLAKSIALKEPDVAIRPALSSRIRAAKSVFSHVKKLDVAQRSQYLDALAKRLGIELPGTERLMLNWDEVDALRRQGVTIGSHTVSHPVLSNVPEIVAAAEITDSKQILEKRTGEPITFFAYPNGAVGDFTEANVDQLKKAGYRAAVTTIRGVNRPGTDLFRLRRTGIYLTDTLSVIKLKLAAETLLGG
jgi:peptidoglycan/xylan/chitin deacetylase (PgdA/CDA1 family)